MCKELTHVKRHLRAKQLIVVPTQLLESRALKHQMPLIIRRLCTRRGKDVALDVAKGLQYLHSHAIVVSRA